MTSNKTEAVVDFPTKGRQQVLEDLALEFPVVHGQWTPTVKVADGVLLRLVSTYRHLGTQASHVARRGPELAARGSSFRRKSGVPCYAQEDPESEASFQEGQGGGCPRGCQLSSALRGLVLGIPSALQTLAQANWMDEEAWRAVRAHAVARRAHQKASPFLPEHGSRRSLRSGRFAVRPDSEQRRQELLWDVEGLARLNLQMAWCRYGMDAQAKAARDAAWQAKQRWMEGQADSTARLQETGDSAATWSAVRKLVGRKKRSFRPLVPMIGDDGSSRVSSGEGQSASARAY